LVLNWV